MVKFLLRNIWKIIIGVTLVEVASWAYICMTLAELVRIHGPM